MFSTRCHLKLTVKLSVILKDNRKSWDKHLPRIEFTYNRVVYKTTNISHFEVVYGLKPITPLNLVPLMDRTSLFHKEGVSRYEFIKKYHDKMQNHIEKQI